MKFSKVYTIKLRRYRDEKIRVGSKDYEKLFAYINMNGPLIEMPLSIDLH